jgi:hypothetical protein
LANDGKDSKKSKKSEQTKNGWNGSHVEVTRCGEKIHRRGYKGNSRV